MCLCVSSGKTVDSGFMNLPHPNEISINRVQVGVRVHSNGNLNFYEKMATTFSITIAFYER